MTWQKKESKQSGLNQWPRYCPCSRLAQPGTVISFLNVSSHYLGKSWCRPMESRQTNSLNSSRAMSILHWINVISQRDNLLRVLNIFSLCIATFTLFLSPTQSKSLKSLSSQSYLHCSLWITFYETVQTYLGLKKRAVKSLIYQLLLPSLDSQPSKL